MHRRSAEWWDEADLWGLITYYTMTGQWAQSWKRHREKASKETVEIFLSVHWTPTTPLGVTKDEVLSSCAPSTQGWANLVDPVEPAVLSPFLSRPVLTIGTKHLRFFWGGFHFSSLTLSLNVTKGMFLEHHSTHNGRGKDTYLKPAVFP